MLSHIQAQIDFTNSKLAKYILDSIYPKLLAPFPSCALCQIESQQLSRFIPKGSSVNVGNEYKFQTVYDIDLYPISIEKIAYDIMQLKIDIKTLSVPIAEMKIDNILFCIQSDFLALALEIYAAICSADSVQIQVNDDLYNANIVLCGLNENETIIQVDKFVNYSFQLLREVLVYPEKFLFFKLINLENILNQQNIYSFSIIFNLNKAINLDKVNILINTVPITNIFNHITDPFRFDGMKNQYKLFSDNYILHSINRVHIINSQTKEENIVPNYFDIDKHSNLFWINTYQNNYVAFIDTNLQPTNIYEDIVYAEITCMNNFDRRSISVNDNVKVISNNVLNAKLLSLPSEVVYQENNLWELINFLSFNHLSKLDNLKEKIMQYASVYNTNNKHLIYHVLDNILNIQYVESSKRINRYLSPVTEIHIDYKLTKDYYYFLLFKVLEKYIDNIRPINSLFELKIHTV